MLRRTRGRITLVWKQSGEGSSGVFERNNIFYKQLLFGKITRVLELFTPLIILSRDYFVEIVLFNCKIPSTISPKSAISSFYSAQITRIFTKCYFFRHLGRTGRKFAYYFYQETISIFYYVKIHTISPKCNFYLLFSIAIRKDHAVKGVTNCMKLYLKGARSAPKIFEILFLPS